MSHDWPENSPYFPRGIIDLFNVATAFEQQLKHEARAVGEIETKKAAS